MSSELGAWLRRQREDRGWTRSEMARQLIRAAKAAGDTSVPSADNISHNIYRWERGAVAPAERYKLYYCGAFAIPFGQFGSSPPQVRPGLADAALLGAFGVLAAFVRGHKHLSPDRGSAHIGRCRIGR